MKCVHCGGEFTADQLQENQGACRLMMNGNRIQIKRRQFEKIIDTLDEI